MDYPTRKGTPYPLGATQQESGVNFSIFSKNASCITLCLFALKSETPFLTLSLNKTGTYWHIQIENLPNIFEYGYKIDGPRNEKKGDLFNPDQLLIDPYATSLSDSTAWGKDGEAPSPKGCFIPKEPFDWEGDKAPNIPMEDLIIYEMHVRAFTQDPSSDVINQGTFLGIIEKIPYLKSLGINAIELLPIHTFNESENKHVDPTTNHPLYNFWGYSTINFFCPMKRYSLWDPIAEFKSLVKALHKEKIEVILDVVYNHTSEGPKGGPTYSFRGIDNRIYYQIDENGDYCNSSGCGNALSANHPIVLRLILDSLHYWANEMHVDGFRFDLISALTRDPDGNPLKTPPIIEAIAHDPQLSNKKLIAEAWDADGLYQVGQFQAWGNWSEWNGLYRDVVRAFIKGTDATAPSFANSLCGSERLYEKSHTPNSSVNFITCHDGFSLRDLVSYQNKHNFANGEKNQDGTNQNLSWNCGVEGPSSDPHISALRDRQMRNFHVALMVSLGPVMLLMGDEYGHTKNGNNNSYCQDNPLNYFLWDHLEKETHFFRFYKGMIQLRKQIKQLQRTQFFTQEDVDWHGKTASAPDWSSTSRLVAYRLKGEGNAFYIAFNAHFEKVTLQLPAPLAGGKWHRIVDTGQIPPFDLIEEEGLQPELLHSYEMQPYSALILKERA